jgi:hypothetical protein
MQVRPVLAAAMLSFALVGRPAAAQSSPAAVQLSVVVPPRVSLGRVGTPVLRSVSDDLAEYSVTIAIDANTSYRISATPAGSAGDAKFVRTADGRRAPLRDHADLVVARGSRGQSTFAVSYWVPADGTTPPADAVPPRFTITLETTREAP